jgi:hypothetical protein
MNSDKEQAVNISSRRGFADRNDALALWLELEDFPLKSRLLGLENTEFNRTGREEQPSIPLFL